ncbi:MAG: winged helix-turn-helix transcriptional regulator [Anaerovoracaceae bacterium]|nr:winged helix-turn-helix transcriptional regulator [Clostridiales bacterium]
MNGGKNVGVNVSVNDGIKINSDKTLNANQQKILNKLDDNPYLTQEEIARILNVSLRTAQRNMSRLQNDGFLIRIGSRKSGHWEILTKLR